MKNNKKALKEASEGSTPKNKWIGWKLPFPQVGPWFLRFVLLALIALFAVMNVSNLSFKAQEWLKTETSDWGLKNVDSDQLIQFIEKENYALPLTLARQNRYQGSNELSPSQIFLPGSDNIYNQIPANQTFQPIFKARLDHLVQGWQSDFVSGNAGIDKMEYEVLHTETHETLKQSKQGLERLFGFGLFNETDLPEQYAFYALVSFNAAGTMTIPVWYGTDTKLRDQLLLNHINRQAFLNEWGAISAETKNGIQSIRPPADFQIAYGLPRETYGSPSNLKWMYVDAMGAAGFPILYGIAIAFGALLGLLPLKSMRRTRTVWGIEKESGTIGIRLPLEVWVIGVTVMILSYGVFAKFNYEFYASSWGNFTTAIAAWVLVLTFWCGLFAFLSEATRDGFAKSLKQRSLIVRLSIWLHTFDPADRSDRSLIKVTAAHFLILAAIVSSAVWIWFYALIPLAVYLLVLLYLFKKQKDRLRQDYARLFDSVRAMAQGNLGIEIDGRMGMFDPLKQELQKVREGFKHALDEETKSQRSKSELVTNVSHDLKTPVTAILTYVNLLQQADLTEEDRKAYIEVLSGKSQRLSRLIEDLFEYTRASSGNTEIAPVSVDLAELLKQAHIELEDKLTEAGVQLRFRLPDHKVIVPLDSEKAFRVFENLYLNIAKYAAPGSRAHIELTELEHEVVVSFKNVSAAELDFKADEITERFVRGDRSRHTEGSGLGLAIVKSLVELQGGTFDLQLDGDLFKAVIRWPMPKRSLETTDVSD